MSPRARSLRDRIGRLKFPLRGRRVDLVLPSRAMVPEFVPLLNDPSVARATLHIPYPYTNRDAQSWVRRSSRTRRAGVALGLCIVRRSDGTLLGGVGLHQFQEESARAEIGYWLGREHRGRGYAAEAVNLLVSVGFRRLALHRIEARVFPGNVASVRLARGCGFRFEGRLRDEVQKDGKWRSTLLFARLARDRPRAQTARRK